MKFNIVIGNPPYNEDVAINRNRTGNNHLPTKAIHKVFFDRSFDWLTQDGRIVFIMPATRWWLKKNKEKVSIQYEAKGLTQIIDKGSPFPGVNANRIGIFYVDKNSTKISRDDFVINHTGDNITKYITKAGIPTAHFRSKMTVDIGGSFVRLTTTRDSIRISNPEVVQDRSHGNWRVGLPYNGTSNTDMGSAILIAPSDYVSSSTVVLQVGDKRTSLDFINYLNSEDIKKLVRETKTSAVNSNINLGFIPTPEWLLKIVEDEV